MRLDRVLLAGVLFAALATPSVAHGAGIEYRTLFQDPGAPPGQDLSLESHAVESDQCHARGRADHLRAA